MAMALQDGVLEKGTSVFDYGSGRGGDVKRLEQLGFSASGWDPNHNPDAEKTISDVVNLGFVINVIEKPAERREVLHSAWELAKRVLVVAARPTWESRGLRGKPFGDGILTAMNSFQKFYEQDELRVFIESTLKRPAMAAAPGIFYVFRDDAHAQKVLAQRARASLAGAPIRASDLFYELHREQLNKLEEFVTRERRLPQPGELPAELESSLANDLGSVRASFALIRRATGPSKWTDVDLGRPNTAEKRFEQNRELLDPLMEFIELRGRLPREGELDILKEINETFKSVRSAFSLIRKITGPERWTKFEEQARRNFLVYCALAAFSGRPKFGELPEDLQYDVRELFGNYTNASKEADQLLFAVGNVATVDLAARASAVGKLTQEALYIHVDSLHCLPPILRVYEGCGRALSGTVDETTIIKMHREKSQVSYLSYPTFDTDAHPALSTVVISRLQQQVLTFRDFRESENPPILHRKETFVHESYRNRDKFHDLTVSEEEAGLLSTHHIGTREGWALHLLENGFCLKGHQLKKLK
jgi:hypothetical protein